MQEERPLPEDLALAGMGWSLWRVIAESAAKLLIGICLARLLLPVHFGLFAIVLLVNGVAGIVCSGGLWAWIIRSRDLGEEETRVAVTLSFLMGTAGFIAVWFAAPGISAFFSMEGATPLLRVSAFELIYLGYGSVLRSMRVRLFDMKTVFFSEAMGTVLGYGLCGIVLAWLGAGAWSLVAGNLARGVIALACLTVAERPPMKPLLRIRPVKRLLGFGGAVTATSVINFAAVKIDNLFVGRFLSSSDLGLYSKAFTLMQIPPSLFSRISSGILFSLMSEIRSDRQRLAKAYLVSLSGASLLCFPVLLAMGVAADLVVVGLYGPNWRGAVDIFRVLLAAGLFKTLLSIAGPVIKAVGLVNREAMRQAVYLLVLAAGAYLGVGYGTKGVAAAVVLGAVWSYWSVSVLVNRRLDLSWRQVFKAQAPALLVGAVVAAVSWFSSLIVGAIITDQQKTVQLALVALACFFAYAGSLLIIPFPMKEDFLRLIRKTVTSKGG